MDLGAPMILSIVVYIGYVEITPRHCTGINYVVYKREKAMAAIATVPATTKGGQG